MQLLRIGAGTDREKFVLSAETQEEATALRFALDKAKAEEREACAAIVEKAEDLDLGSYIGAGDTACASGFVPDNEMIAAAIRARGN